MATDKTGGVGDDQMAMIKDQFAANEKRQMEMMVLKDQHETVMSILQQGMAGAKPAAR